MVRINNDSVFIKKISLDIKIDMQEMMCESRIPENSRIAGKAYKPSCPIGGAWNVGE